MPVKRMGSQSNTDASLLTRPCCDEGRTIASNKRAEATPDKLDNYDIGAVMPAYPTATAAKVRPNFALVGKRSTPRSSNIATTMAAAFP